MCIYNASADWGVCCPHRRRRRRRWLASRVTCPWLALWLYSAAEFVGAFRSNNQSSERVDDTIKSPD